MRIALKALQDKYECFGALHLDEFEKEHIRLMNEVYLSQILTGMMTLDEGRAVRFKKAFEVCGVNADEKLISEASASYRSVYLTVNGLVKGAYELLEALRNQYKIGIITNNLVSEQEMKLRKGGIEHLVDVMLTSEEAGVAKPHPDIFNAMLKKLDVTADEVVMIGDYWNSDITGAHHLGIRCIWINVYDEICPNPEMAIEVKSIEDTEQMLNIIKEAFSH